jgi:hypothetical protein
MARRHPRPAHSRTGRYRRWSFAGSISAEPDLAERSEEIIEEMFRRNVE